MRNVKNKLIMHTPAKNNIIFYEYKTVVVQIATADHSEESTHNVALDEQTAPHRPTRTCIMSAWHVGVTVTTRCGHMAARRSASEMSAYVPCRQRLVITMRRSGDEAAMSVVVMVTSQQPLSFSSYHYAPPPSIVVMPTAELAQRCSDIYPPPGNLLHPLPR